ncbi:uncharacterized protein CTRU02_209603 [Colletotrichum truncatum]|uniref:Uncharacterized protein n=1 Tax=Colletotrichum truncatum TaxID=5467 RepID=A0ACC3YV50_COLTU
MHPRVRSFRRVIILRLSEFLEGASGQRLTLGSLGRGLPAGVEIIAEACGYTTIAADTTSMYKRTDTA